MCNFLQLLYKSICPPFPKIYCRQLPDIAPPKTPQQKFEGNSASSGAAAAHCQLDISDVIITDISGAAAVVPSRGN